MMLKKNIYVCFALVTLVLLCFSTGSSFAHGLYFYAWVEGEQVCTEGYYSDSQKVFGGNILVSNLAGQEVARGLSNEEGKWCFTPEVRETLVMSLHDSQGHRAEYKLEGQFMPETSTRAASKTVLQPLPADDNNDNIRKIVREELALQLAPVQKALHQGSTPSLQAILGGLGWILGVCGIAALIYAKCGKKI